MRAGGRRLAVMLSAALLGATAAVTMPAGPASALEPGDSQRFDTWAGYEVNRYPVEALAGDFDEDGSPDVAWVRNDFFENTLSVTLNLGEGTLDDPVEYPANESSTDGDLADLNGDGHLDAVVVADFSSTVDLYFGDGTGAFTHATTPGGDDPAQVVATDLDGDGDADLAMTNSFFSASVSVLLNAGDGTFGAETVYPVGERPGGIVPTDFDADGILDLVVAAGGFSGGELALYPLLGDGTGDFTPGDPVPFPGLAESPVLAGGDFDDDGDLDYLTAGIRSDGTTLLRNGGDGTFTTDQIPGGFSSGDIEVLDLEPDGDLDAVSATFGSSQSGDITVLRNAGDATFTTASLTSSQQPMGIDVADFDLDGDPDVAAANRGSSLGVIHPGSAGGTFEQPPQAPLFAPPFKITTGDLDGDGDTDVAASIQGFSTSDQVVQLLLNDGTGTLVPSGTVPALGRPFSIDAADFDLDGDDDLVWQLAGYSQPDVGVALSNGDGTFADAFAIRENDCAPGQISTADMDGDGDPDIVMPDEGGGEFGSDCVQGQSVTIIPSLGDGTFGNGIRVETEALPQHALGADMDGDGLNDVVSAHLSGNGGDLAVALNNGDGTFAQHVEIDTGRSHREIAAADLDGDGDVDVAGVDTDDGITVFLNDGSGVAFTTEVYDGETVNGYLNAVAIDIGDVDVDGVPDIAVANWTGNDVGVWYGHGDGTFSPRAIHYGMNTAITDLELADFDGDGLVDVATPNTQANATTMASAGRTSARAAEAGAVRAEAVAAAPNGVSVAFNDGAPQCTVRGSTGDDDVTGTPRADIICTFAGNDTVNGRGGNDVIVTGAGDDRVLGGDGDDTIDVGTGRDYVLAGDGDDAVLAIDGNDRLEGGGGRDRLTSGTGNDRLYGGAGVDTLVAGKGLDLLNGGRGHDRCNGGADRDQSTSCEVRVNIP
ncbi:MAG TPA: FG-GAP-like repeat-containing protein [Acidimicrobiales bacterium]